MPELPRAHGEALSAVLFRRSPEDFIVTEKLIFEPDGEGEHVYLQVKKRNTNTIWLARELARYAGIRQRDVGYAGLKDRNAVTTQWYSLHIHKNNEPDWDRYNQSGVEILSATRHRSKLRPGMVRYNNFSITLYGAACKPEQFDERIRCIQAKGVPNYFGEQRFGHNRQNLDQAITLFTGNIKIKDRKKRGIILSAARSYLFNQVLAERVRQGNWDVALAGDCMMLAGSNSFFRLEQPDIDIEKRLAEFDVHPSGPMWGVGEVLTGQEAMQLESNILQNEVLFRQGLEQAGLKMDRRTLRMLPKDLTYDFIESDTIRLEFSLSSGQYATTVLAELFNCQQPG